MFELAPDNVDKSLLTQFSTCPTAPPAPPPPPQPAKVVQRAVAINTFLNGFFIVI